MTKYYGITCRGYEQRQVEADCHLVENGLTVQWMRGLSGVHSGVTTSNPFTFHDKDATDVISCGHVALCINHWFAWNQAYRDGCDVAIFVEDDCRVIDGFRDKLGNALAELEVIDNGWDFLYVGHWEGSSCPEVKGHCYEAIRGSIATLKCSPFGTHCYAVSRNGLRLLIDSCERIHAHIDISLWLDAGPKLKQYACAPPLSHQQVTGEIYQTTLTYSSQRDFFANQ